MARKCRSLGIHDSHAVSGTRAVLTCSCGAQFSHRYGTIHETRAAVQTAHREHVQTARQRRLPLLIPTTQGTLF